MKKFLHRFGHFWKEYPVARKPSRADWFCHLRQCTVCRRVEYLSFATFGDKKWHDINVGGGCWEHELKGIREAAVHNGLVSFEELARQKADEWNRARGERRKNFDAVMKDLKMHDTPREMDGLFEAFETLFDVLDIKNYTDEQKQRLREDMLSIKNKK